MSKLIKNLLFTLFILASAGVLSAGLLFISYTVNTERFGQRHVEKEVTQDPETIVDEQVRAAGRNFTVSTNEDANQVYEFHLGNVEYQTEDGSYAPIDTTVVAAAADEVAYENTTNAFQTYFKESADEDNLVTYAVAGDRSASFGFVHGQATDATAEGNTVSYADVYDGMDAVYTVTNDQLLEELVVKEPSALKDRITQRLQVSGVYYREREDGSITFHDNETGNFVFMLPRPVMYEQQEREDGTRPTNWGLHYEVAETEDGFEISKVIDTAGKDWLANAAYPVVVDFTFAYSTLDPDMSGNVWRDCTYGSAYCSGFLWNLQTLSSGITTTSVAKESRRLTATIGRRRTYLNFYTAALDGVPAADIVSASLRVAGYPYNTNSFWYMPDDCPVVNAYMYNGTTGPYISGLESTPQEVYDKIGAMSGSAGSFNLGTLIARANWNNTYCVNNPASCSVTLPLTTSLFADNLWVQFGLREDSICSDTTDDDRWHGVVLYTQLATIANLRPQLTVIVRPRPVLTVAVPDHNHHDRLTVSWLDNNNDETGWELQRATNSSFSGYNGFTLTTGGTGSCGTNCTYTCNTITPGYNNGTQCTATLTGLAADTHYYFRARTTITSVPESAWSAWSDTKDDWTRAAPEPGVSNLVTVSSPRWNRIAFTGCPGMTIGSPVEANQMGTPYTVGIMGDFGDPLWGWQFLGAPSGSPPVYSIEYPWDDPSHVDGFATNVGYYLPRVGVAPTWASVTGGNCTGTITMQGLGLVSSIRPDHSFFLGDYSRDQRPSGKITHCPAGDCVSENMEVVQSRSRNTQAINLTDSTATTMTLLLDNDYSNGGTVPSEFDFWQNPSSTTYVMQVKHSQNQWTDAYPAVFYLNPLAPGSRYSGAVWRTGSQWDDNFHGVVGDGVTFTGFSSTTCYDIRTKSRNSAGVEGEDVSADPWVYTSTCTEPAPPAAPTVVCRYDSSVGTTGYYCDVTINDSNNTNPQVTFEYQVERPDGTIVAAYPQSKATPVKVDDLPCADNLQEFRVVVRASLNGQWYYSDPSPVGSNTLPPCKPTWAAPNHNAQDLNSLTWDWNSVANAESYSIFEETNEVGFVSHPATELLHGGLDINTQYEVTVRAKNASGFGEPSDPASAYTSIEEVSGITINDDGTDDSDVTPTSIIARAAGTFTNLRVDNSGILFQESSGNPGGGGDDQFQVYQNDTTVTDSGLTPNTQYLYRAQSRNGDGIIGGVGDYTGFKPDVAVSKYTHAVRPARPLVAKTVTGDVRLTIRDDANPRGLNPGDADTKYAICVAKYNDDGSTTQKYVFHDNYDGLPNGSTSVNWGVCGDPAYTTEADCEANSETWGYCSNSDYQNDPIQCASNGGSWDESPSCNTPPDSLGHWADYDPGWGGSNGIVITGLEASTKYDYKLKAKNEEGYATHFGSEATLFLVKNNVVGWAWSSNYGWFSLNCLNRYDLDDYSCHPGLHWGLNSDYEAERELNPLEGYAWSGSGRAQANGRCSDDPNDTCVVTADCSPGATCDFEKPIIGGGWVSLFSRVCDNDTQHGCLDNDDCGVGTCEESAGLPPGNTLYGYCFTNQDPDGLRYGYCSNDTTGTRSCTENSIDNCEGTCSVGGTLCISDAICVPLGGTCVKEAHCVYETCRSDVVSCSDFAGGATEECRPYATANFNGTSKEIEGWARSLSLKKAGEDTDCNPVMPGQQDCTNWGWIRLNDQGTTSDFSLMGVEVDSQQFFQDPDVNPEGVQLYSLFGWGWQAHEFDQSGVSTWLKAMNTSASGQAMTAFTNDAGDGSRASSIAVDANGQPHLAWSEYNAANASYDIYYVRMRDSRWETITGEAYVPGTTDPVGSALNVSASAEHAFWPSLKLDSNDLPRITWQQGGTKSAGGNVYYATWNSSTTAWDKQLVAAGGTPSLAVDNEDQPHIAYRTGDAADAEINYRWHDGANWISGVLNVSDTAGTPSLTPDLELDEGTPQQPHIVWVEGTEVYYRYWNDTASAWVSASNDGSNLSLNSDVAGLGLGIAAPNGRDPDVALYSDGTPGVLWRDPDTVLYRRWNGSAWTDADGSGTDSIMVNLAEGGDETHLAETGKGPSLRIDPENRPHVIWGDAPVSDSSQVGDIRYRRWDETSNEWVTAQGVGEPAGPHYDDSGLTVDVSDNIYSQSPTLALDRWGAAHLAWQDTVIGDEYCGAFSFTGAVLGSARDIAIDDEYMYVVGQASPSNDWRIEKRRLDTGALDNGFGTVGAVTSTAGSVSGSQVAIALDSSYMYVAGTGDNSDWRIEKRRLSDGTLCTDALPCDGEGFGDGDGTDGNGAIDVDPGSFTGRDIAIDGQYMYVVGDDATPDWRIEKRRLSDGTLCTDTNQCGGNGFGYDAADVYAGNGIVTSSVFTPGGPDPKHAHAIVIDDEFMYVVGAADWLDGGTAQNDYLWHIQKRRLSDGALCTGGTCGEDFGDSDSGRITIPRADRVNVQEPSHAMRVALLDNSLIIGGRYDFTYYDDIQSRWRSAIDWRIEKRDKRTGDNDISFGDDSDSSGEPDGWVRSTPGTGETDYFYGMTTDSMDIYATGTDYNGDLWTEKRGLSTGALVNAFDPLPLPEGVVRVQDGSNIGYQTAVDSHYLYTVGGKNAGSGYYWHIEKRWKDTGALDASIDRRDCSTDEYPQCIQTQVGPPLAGYCGATDVQYSRWTPGRVRAGIGWLEFMPANALLGIPWVKTAYGDIYAQDDIKLAPPPRGTGDTTATYLIQSDGSIQGIQGSGSDRPTSGLNQTGLNPLVTDSGHPVGQNAVSNIDVAGITTVVNTENNSNRYGHVVDARPAGDIGAAIGATPLGGKVYVFNGPSTIDTEVAFAKGAEAIRGNGTIVVNGDLVINANTHYDTAALSAISEMPSVAFIVRGNIFVHPHVSELVGVFVAMDEHLGDTTEIGQLSTGRGEPVDKDAAATDDTYVALSGGVYTNATGTPSLHIGKSATETYRTALRWSLADIPAGSEIKKAYITFTGNGTGTADDFDARIYLMDIDDASDGAGHVNFTTGTDTLYNVDTTNSILFPIFGAWTNDVSYQTPDISSLIQKFVNRPDFDAATDDIGIIIKEGNAADGEWRGIQSAEATNAPVLHIEYAPRRATFTIDDAGDDATAWDNTTGLSTVDDIWVGHNAVGPRNQRGYLRFVGIDVPTDADVESAHLRLEVAASGAGEFEFRQALLPNYPQDFVTLNPFTDTIDTSVAEVSETIGAGTWGAGTVVVTRDSSRLVESFIARDTYQPGVPNSSEMVLQLSGRHEGTEANLQDGMSRTFTKGASQLEVDYYVPLEVRGLLVAHGFNFDRPYFKNLAAAEQILYDGRVVANTPPGLADFSRALPVYNRVIP